MITFILLSIFSLHVRAFELTQISEIVGQVINLECDSNFNCYAATLLGDPDDSTDYRFYKIDTNKTIVLQTNFTRIYYMVKNSKDNIYVFATNTTDSIYLLTPNSEELKLIYQYPGEYYINRFNNFIIDEEDNIIFNVFTGIVMLKSNLNTPIAVKNLESCYFSGNEATVDHQGNIYLVRWCDTRLMIPPGVVVITSASKHQPVPFATVVEELKGDIINANQSITYNSATDSHNNVIFSLSRYSPGKWDKGEIKVIRDGSVESILSEYYMHVVYNTFEVTRDKTFFVANMNDKTTDSYLYFVDSDAKIKKIDGILPVEPYGWYYLKSDVNGNLFFGKSRTELVWIRNNETEVRELFKTPVYGINWFYGDSSNVVWVHIYNYYFSIPLNSGVPTKHNSEVYVGDVHYFRENLKTKEIYLGGERGVFVLNTQE